MKKYLYCQLSLIRATPIYQSGEIWLLPILLVATFLRMFHLTLYPFNGDEYNTISEVKNFGSTWQSIIYMAPMHLWQQLGSDEFWLRIPSVFFGIMTIPLLFILGKRISGNTLGIIAAALGATSPFNIYHSQSFRFYSLFIFASCLFFWITNKWMVTRRTLLIQILPCGVLLIFSHFLGVLAAFSFLIVVYLIPNSDKNHHNSVKKRWLFVSICWCIFVVIPLIPGFLPALWKLYRYIGHAPGTIVPEIVPLSFVNLAKLSLAVFIFQFGYHVYPLNYTIVVPGILLVSICLIVGFCEFKRKKQIALPIVFVAMLITVYTILDSVGGRLARGVAPRHVSFIWPVFLMIIAIGLSKLPKRILIGFTSLLVFVQLLSLIPRWTMDWSYSTLIDYRQAGKYVEPWVSDQTAILYDGRSIDPVKLYFPHNITSIGYWPFLEKDSVNELSIYDPIIFVTNDFQQERRLGFDRIAELLSDEYIWVDGRVEYPLFDVIFVRKDGPYIPPASSYGQLHPLINYFGLEFQDLRLPVDLQIDGLQLHVVGATQLPNLSGNRELVIPVNKNHASDRLVLVSTALAMSDVDGDTVAIINVYGSDGSTFSIPIRSGIETEIWTEVCAPEAPCETVYRWHKRVAMVGQYSYPGAYSDFQAGMHGVTIPFPKVTEVDHLVITSFSDNYPLYIWAIALPILN